MSGEGQRIAAAACVPNRAFRRSGRIFMKRPRIPPRWRIPLLLVLLLPPLCWALLLAVAPTDWARQRFAARMSAATGRSVRIATVRVGALGGIYLTGLEIGAPGGADDPWLKVAQASINVSPWQLLCRHVEPTETVVQGIDLRVLRRGDGTFELEDLIRGVETDAAETASGASTCPLSRLALRIKDARATVIDVPTGTRLEFHDLEGRAVSEERSATIQELRGTFNGGTFELAAQLDRSTAAPWFEGHLRASGIALDKGMKALAYLAPVLASPSGNLEGTLDLNLYLRGQGATRAALRKTIVGSGTVSLDPIHLDGSRLLDELAAVVDMPAQQRVGSVKSDFAIKQGRITSDNLTISITKVPIVLAGWTDFSGTVNYRLRGESVMERLPGKAREFLAELSIDARDLSALRVEGAVGAPEVTLGGVPLGHAPVENSDDKPAGGDDRERLRALGRRLRDQILR
jgi:AsmA protein